MGSHHGRKILPSYPRSSAATFAPGSTPSPRVHLCPLVSAGKSSPNSSGSLQGRWRGPKVSFGCRPVSLLRQEQWATKHHLSLQLSLLSLSRGRSLLARSILAQSSGAENQAQGWHKRGGGGGVVRTHWPRHQASTSQEELDQEEELARFYLGFSSASHCLGPLPGRWSRAQPAALAGKSLCRKDWLQLREIAAYPWCTVCEPPLQTQPQGAMVSVCRQGRWPLHRRSGQCPRFRTRTLGVGPRRGWARTSAFASACCTVPAAVPSARASVSASVVPTWKSPHLRLAHSQHRAKHQKSVLSGNHFASCSVEPLFAPQHFWLRNQQQQSSNVGASQILGSGRSAAEPPCEEIVCAGRPLVPSVAERDIVLEAIAGETVPTRWPGRRPPKTSSRQHSRSCGAPKRDRWRHRRGGELRARSCKCSEKQTIFHFSSLPCHHLTTPLHAPNHSNFWPL